MQTAAKSRGTVKRENKRTEKQAAEKVRGLLCLCCRCIKIGFFRQGNSLNGGVLLGAIPGMTATMGVALLIPFSFGMDLIPSIGLLLGIYCGGMYGGSISAILIHAPGTPAAAATLLDG